MSCRIFEQYARIFSSHLTLTESQRYTCLTLANIYDYFITKGANKGKSTHRNHAPGI